MFCKKCGATIPDYASFCNVCGESQTAIVEEVNPPVVDQIKDAPIAPAVETAAVEEPKKEVSQQPAPEISISKDLVVQNFTPKSPVAPVPVVEKATPGVFAPPAFAPAKGQMPMQVAPQVKVKGSAVASLVLGVISFTLLMVFFFFSFIGYLGLALELGAIALPYLMAFGCLVGVVSFFPSLIGFIMGLCAKKDDTTGMAKAGFIINFIVFLISVVLIGIAIIVLKSFAMDPQGFYNSIYEMSFF